MDAAMINTAQMAARRPLSAAEPTKNEKRAQAVGKQFEAQFMTQMLEHMFSGINAEKGMFGGGHAEAMFRPMLLEQYGKMIANQGNGIGIASKVTQVLLSHQEVRQ